MIAWPWLIPAFLAGLVTGAGLLWLGAWLAGLFIERATGARP